MSLIQLLLLAVVLMAGLAVLRVVRVRADRSPLPESRNLFILAFLIVPPVLVGALFGGAAGAMGGVSAVPLYGLLVGAVAIVMWMASLLIPRLVPGRSRAILQLALTGSEGDPEAVPYDPPVTPQIAASVTALDRANGAFPRGPEFPQQVDREGFRASWDALETATKTLEGQIVEEHRLGLPVAASALARARDARERLDTLRRLASDGGQAWASAGPMVATG